MCGQPGSTGVLVAVAFALPLVLVILSGSFIDLQPVRREPQRLRKYLLGLALFLPVLASASITFRQEYRWLYAPFLVLLLGASWALAQFRATSYVAIGAVVLVFGGSVTVDGYYHHYLDNTYFFQAQLAASSVRQQVIDDRISFYWDWFLRRRSSSYRATPHFGQWDLGNGTIFRHTLPRRGGGCPLFVSTFQDVCQAEQYSTEPTCLRRGRFERGDQYDCVNIEGVRSIGTVSLDSPSGPIDLGLRCSSGAPKAGARSIAEIDDGSGQLFSHNGRGTL